MSFRITSCVGILVLVALMVLAVFTSTGEASHTNDGACHLCPIGTITGPAPPYKTYPGGPGFTFGYTGTDDKDLNYLGALVTDGFTETWTENAFLDNNTFTPTKDNVGVNSVNL